MAAVDYWGRVFLTVCVAFVLILGNAVLTGGYSTSCNADGNASGGDRYQPAATEPIVTRN
jgi:hypothetical protein